MTEKTIQMNLTEEQFNIIWNALVLSENEMVDDEDVRVRIETLNEMEVIMEELGLEVFDNYEEAQLLWWNRTGNFLSHIEVIDRKQEAKGFK